METPDPVTPRRSNGLVRLVALTVAVCVVFWSAVTYLLPPPDLPRAQKQAGELQALLLKRPEFSQVMVTPFTNGKLVVLAPDELSTATKAELEQFVTRRAPEGTGSVSYMRTIDPVSTNP